jgi:hypothetical protein
MKNIKTTNKTYLGLIIHNLLFTKGFVIFQQIATPQFPSYYQLHHPISQMFINPIVLTYKKIKIVKKKINIHKTTNKAKNGNINKISLFFKAFIMIVPT